MTAKEHIRVTEATKERLEKRGNKGESFNDIVATLLDKTESVEA